VRKVVPNVAKLTRVKSGENGNLVKRVGKGCDIMCVICLSTCAGFAVCTEWCHCVMGQQSNPPIFGVYTHVTRFCKPFGTKLIWQSTWVWKSGSESRPVFTWESDIGCVFAVLKGGSVGKWWKRGVNLVRVGKTRQKPSVLITKLGLDTVGNLVDFEKGCVYFTIWWKVG